MSLVKITKQVAESRFAATSLLLHIILITLLGSVVLFKSVESNEEFLVASGSADGFLTDEPASVVETSEMAEPQEFEEESAPQMEVTAAKSFAGEMSALAAPTGVWTVSSPSETYSRSSSIGSGTQASLGNVGTGQAKGPGGAKLGKMGSRSLFGTKIEANKLGALVDISGTATPFLLPTLREVHKNFQDSPIVLAVGCGLARSKGTAVPFDQVDLEQVIPAGTYTGIGYLQSTMAKSKEVERMVRKLKTTPEVFMLEGNGLDVGMAIDKLVDTQVDAIYWFSDFRDRVDGTMGKAVAEKLKAKGIKLYIHTFTGQPVPPIQTEMVEITGGKIITEIPK